MLRWHEPGHHPSGQPIKLYPCRKGFNIKAMMADPGYSALEEVREVSARGYQGRFSAQKPFIPFC